MDDLIDIEDFKGKEVYYYNSVEKFFDSCPEKEIIRMTKIIDGKYKVSLRFLDWFITRYCYLHKVTYDIDNDFIKSDNFNINIGYKAQLKSYKKKYFDPFRRKKKFLFTKNFANPIQIITTIGQLNFFKWAITYDIINYVYKNFDDIYSKYESVNEYFKKKLEYSTTSDDIEVLKEKADNAKKLYEWKLETEERKSKKTGKIILEF